MPNRLSAMHSQPVRTAASKRVRNLVRGAVSKQPLQTGPRKVQCYRCRHLFEISIHAKSTACPGCAKPVIVEDLILKKNRPKLVMVTNLQTCGCIIVPKRSRLIAAHTIEAALGIQIHGHLRARKVLSGGKVVIGRGGVWHGDLKAPSIVVEAGAVIAEGEFEVTGYFAEATNPLVADHVSPP